ncbi:MAG: DUF3108 domain-containing protein [Fermentimonas sp.]|nr:DUF3108 domain-containing protein [Fermentimonas sp.]
MIKKATSIFSLLILLFIFQPSNAQCIINNTAFASGENIEYDLYFNFGLFRARAGKGSLSITESNYRGVNSLKTVMLLNTSGLAGNIYSVSDTLTSYIDKDMRPLLFTKEAHEGGDYSIERQSYTYDGNKIKIRSLRTFNGEERFDEVFESDKCTYDYLSVLSMIRNIDFSGMKPGERKFIQFISGRKAVNMYVNYQGISNIRANDGKRYEVIDLTLTVHDDAFENQKDALKASLTNDKNRVPIIIDTSLNIGSIRAVMKNARGLRN